MNSCPLTTLNDNLESDGGGGSYNAKRRKKAAYKFYLLESKAKPADLWKFKFGNQKKKIYMG